MNIVHCRHIIEVTKNTKVSKCLDCNHTRNVSKCERKFEESLEIEKGNIFSPFTLNNLDLMNEMFMDPAIWKLNNFDQLEEKVVLSENFDIFYTLIFFFWLKNVHQKDGKPQWRRNEQWTSYEYYKKWTKWRQNEWRLNELTQNKQWTSDDEGKVNFLCWWIALFLILCYN